ncbi:MAG TPA: DUF1290 domain-containing protein, partial [Firmicutes bacterium]|nr:DUF1290 domain-containing protein [Bacillota bacterium]
MLIPLLGTALGIFRGFLIPVEIPVNMVSY